MSEQQSGAWIFVSHSSKDWVKVREIRNILEEEGQYPLLFHLKCLSDEVEINDLLKREIEARNWFVLCDSINARESPYVSTEIEYIKSIEGKVFETIDLEKDISTQVNKLMRLSKRATVFISSTGRDSDLSREVARILRKNDYKVFNANEDIALGEDWKSRIEDEIINATNNGFFLQLITENSLRSAFVQEEVRMALEMSRVSVRRNNIIPISFIQPERLFEIPAELHDIQIADFSHGSLESNLLKLIEELKFKEMA